ncbi:hypothetical protein PVAP13_1KG458310 [Panicum virgatum]|uniref:Uncharacterized protein n=1 Tax=Panicum virgatum TaxID=38727 RepID=A0A8T0XL59_PANVG|nr:hypothetical protein PVAP13_1KG458310 [Panicum virgatum]
MPGAGVFSELMWNSRNVSASAFLGRGHAVGAVDGCGSSPLKGGREVIRKGSSRRPLRCGFISRCRRGGIWIGNTRDMSDSEAWR